MNKSNWLAAGVAVVLMLSCSSQRAPAEQTVADTDAALSAIHDSAAKYSPDSLQAAEAQVAALKANLAKGNYKEVLADAPAANTAIASLKQDADAKQAAADAALAQTKQQWLALNEDVPKMIADIHAQVDRLSKERRLPQGLSRASFESAKADAASLDSMWADASNTVMNQDNYAGAIPKGQAVKEKATGIMKKLGIKAS